ncbi:hypothetical protein OIB37_34845 [Streptomyces sp. NBC_00820]|uniref:hypothetical protein n=1 Tax=Streptomyces sp. NBC_00820 TaxID=2975842 RepID=UPI002ED2294A|nr:hypothetical protein OIB37_34845 [Streptomyces sp. NBC_00820]
MTTELRLFADYHQIHVMDENSESDLGDAWTEQAVRDGLAAAEDVLAIGTTVNVHVAVRVDVLDGEPDDDSAGFDHVVEASLRVPSGQLVVMGCSDYLPEARRFKVPAGWTRVRACRRNLAAAARADVDSGDRPETTERVRLQIWPAPHDRPHVAKRWQRAGA